jgi:hypothetical protein
MNPAAFDWPDNDCKSCGKSLSDCDCAGAR